MDATRVYTDTRIVGMCAWPDVCYEAVSPPNYYSNYFYSIKYMRETLYSMDGFASGKRAP